MFYFRQRIRTMHYKDLEIVYEDNHLLAVIKPSGILIHGDETKDRSLRDVVEDYIRYTYNKPGNVFVGLTHRLDRPVSGLCLFAKTGKALSRMNRMFQDQKVKKTYLAISKNKPENLSGILTDYLIKDQERNKVKLYDQPKKNAKKCSLEYELIAVVNGYSLIRVNPITGRSHQIRAQLAKMGCTIIGDAKYGRYTKFLEDKSIGLHCFRMTFQHPTLQTEMSLTAPMPKKVIWNFFEAPEI